MKPSSSHLLILAVGLAAGLASGWCGATLRAHGSDSSSEVPAAAVARSEVPVARCVASIDEAQLAELRAEIAALAASRPGTGSEGAPAAPAAPRPPSAESVAASEDAAQRVDEAIGRGAWTDRDRIALRGVMPELTNEQTEVVMSKLVLAINEGRLKLDSPGPLF